jgi:predicted flap endonuclease-1-like 5' DNA nuclease
LSFPGYLWHNNQKFSFAPCREERFTVPARERLTPTEQYVAYLIGAGVALAMAALMFIGFGTIANSDITTSVLLVGVALAVIGIAAWLILVHPWEGFDDLTTPQYTGHASHEHAAAESAHGDDLQIIEGIGPKAAAALHAAGITSFGQIAQTPPADLEAAVRARGVRLVGHANTWPAQAKMALTGDLTALEDLKQRIKSGTLHEDLTQIEGIGPKVQAALYEAGFTTFAQIAGAAPADLENIVKSKGVRLVGHTDSWPAQAKLLVAGNATSVEELKHRIKGGVLHEDLTQIEGIGPKAQAALYAAGITTFRALAATSQGQLRAALDAAGLRTLQPASWPQQADLIAHGDLTGLRALQDRLRGGR